MLKMKIHALVFLIGLSLLTGYAFSESDLQVKWSYGMNKTSSAVVLGVKVADFDGDGFNDIAVAAKEDRIEGSAGWVYLLNNDGTLKWVHDTPGAITAMLVDDLSGDGKPQILAALSRTARDSRSRIAWTARQASGARLVFVFCLSTP